MEQVSLKEQLTNLINLQKIDSEIYKLQREKQAKPEEIKTIEAAFEAKKQGLAELEKTSLDLQKQKKDKELELASKDEAAKKLQGQLFQLKTNKEYQTMLQQIADTKTDASVIEEKILIIMEQMDKVKVDVDTEKQKLKEEEKLFNEQKAKVQVRVKEIDDRVSVLDGQRKQIAPAIDPKIITQYERILANRDGLAIVLAKNNSCQGCNMYVPPQVINLIKMYDHIITCEMCNRILYIDDETA
ncbi:MAG: C4-type zinc ribbon domain-containing protein [Candidatus Omnitrophota bacterium]